MFSETSAVRLSFFLIHGGGAGSLKPLIYEDATELLKSLVSTVSQPLMDKCEVERDSDLPGSSDIAGRCTPEVLYTDVLFVGLDDERQCPKSCPIC